jgi:1,4-alpha-glucan branching enzyme
LQILTGPSFNIPGSGPANLCHLHEENKIIAFFRGGLLFVFNFHDRRSYTDYHIPAPPGRYGMVLNTDEKAFGGQERLTQGQVHFTTPSKVSGEVDAHFLSLYLPTRTAVVLINYFGRRNC